MGNVQKQKEHMSEQQNMNTTARGHGKEKEEDVLSSLLS